MDAGGFAKPVENIKRLKLEAGMRVADVGSGGGDYTLALAKALLEIGDDSVVYAVDVQKDLLERVKMLADEQGLGNIETIWGDADLPGGIKLADGVCDAVVVSNTLFQADDHVNFAKECARILKPSGELLLVEWSDSYGHMGPAPEAVIAATRAKELFKNAGLSLSNEFAAGEHHYGLLFSK